MSINIDINTMFILVVGLCRKYTVNVLWTEIIILFIYLFFVMYFQGC